jgi:hypothetical protein
MALLRKAGDSCAAARAADRQDTGNYRRAARSRGRNHCNSAIAAALWWRSRRRQGNLGFAAQQKAGRKSPDAVRLLPPES